MNLRKQRAGSCIACHGTTSIEPLVGITMMTIPAAISLPGYPARMFSFKLTPPLLQKFRTGASNRFGECGFGTGVKASKINLYCPAPAWIRDHCPSRRWGETGNAVPSSCANSETLYSSTIQRNSSSRCRASMAFGGFAANVFNLAR